MKWDRRFLELAKYISLWSKDPSTQCGAVIVRPDRTIASVGYNGFPRGCDDSPELYADREAKYARVVHCEMNAILSAREPLQGYTLYTWPFLTCDRCAVHVIQAGIDCVVACTCPEDKKERWGEMFKRAHALYAEAGVGVLELDMRHEWPQHTARDEDWCYLCLSPRELCVHHDEKMLAHWDKQRAAPVPPKVIWGDPGDENAPRSR